MVLKKIDNNTEKKKKISVTTGLRSDRDLDIVAFGGGEKNIHVHRVESPLCRLRCRGLGIFQKISKWECSGPDSSKPD